MANARSLSEVSDLVDLGAGSLALPVARPKLPIAQTFYRAFFLWAKQSGILLLVAVGLFAAIMLLLCLPWILGFDPDIKAWALAFAIGMFYLGAVFCAAVIFRVDRAMENERPTVRETLGTALFASPRVFAIFFLTHACIYIAARLLTPEIATAPEDETRHLTRLVVTNFLAVTAGFYLAAAFWVAAPASICERLGPIRSMKESWILTRNNRWRIIGILGLLLAVVPGYAWIVQSLVRAPGEQGGLWVLRPDALSGVDLLVSLSFTFLILFFVLSYATVAATLAHHELRAAWKPPSEEASIDADEQQETWIDEMEDEEDKDDDRGA